MDMSIPTQGIECLERRKKERLEQESGWVKSAAWNHSYKRDMNGHHLLIFKPNSGGHYWFMWMDGVARGRNLTLKLCKMQLEAFTRLP